MTAVLRHSQTIATTTGGDLVVGLGLTTNPGDTIVVAVVEDAGSPSGGGVTWASSGCPGVYVGADATGGATQITVPTYAGEPAAGLVMVFSGLSTLSPVGAATQIAVPPNASATTSALGFTGADYVLGIAAFFGSVAPGLSVPTGIGIPLSSLDDFSDNDGTYYAQIAAAGAAPTTPGSLSASSTNSTSQANAYLGLLVLQGYSAPAPPSLVSPANASYEDVSTDPAFTLGYQSTDGTAQIAYAFGLKTSGASSYSYFNASTNAMQSSVVWNSDSVAVSGTWQVTLPSGTLADGNVYNWTAASQSASGGANLQGAFASASTFTAQAPPTVSVTAPTGTISGTLTPAVDWTGAFPSGATQTGYEVIVESGAFSTTPGSGTQAYSSGVVASSASSASIASGLVTATTYRAFVQLTESGGQTSSWGYTAFTLGVDVPAQPLFTADPTADPTTGAPMVILTAQPEDNFLTAVDASFETGVGTWTAGPNWTVAQDSTHALDGSYALLCKRANTTATNGYAQNAVYTLEPGASYVAEAAVLGDASSTGLPYTVVVQLAGTHRTVTATFTMSEGWQVVSVPFTVAATGETGANLLVTDDPQSAPASGQQFWLDECGIFPAGATSWAAGGFVGTTSVNFTFSDDGVNWYPVRNGTNVPIASTQAPVVVNDYEGALGFIRQYRCQVVSG